MPSPDELKRFNQNLITEFRNSEGQVSSWNSLLLLTTQGAKSNKPHTTPLAYTTDGDHLVIVGAAVGSPKHPAWYYTLHGHKLRLFDGVGSAICDRGHYITCLPILT